MRARSLLLAGSAALVLGLAPPAALPVRAQDGAPVAVSLSDGIGATRLVIGRWPAAGWSVQQFENLVEIRFPGTVMALDLASVSLAGTEGHLVDVSSEVVEGDTILRLTLGCACAVAMTGDGASELAIDVVGTVFAEAAGAPSAGPAPERAPPPVARAAAPAGETAGRDGPVPLDPEAARERLLRELERAAAAGIVTLTDPDDPLLAGAEGTPPVDPEAPASPEAAPPPADPPPEATRGTAPEATPPAETPGHGSDHAEAPEAGGPPATGSEAGHGGAAGPEHEGAPEAPEEQATPEVLADMPCLPDADLTLAVRDPRIGLMIEIAGLNARLLGEFDAADPETAIELARLYLEAGLGIEARQVLTDFAPGHRLAGVLGAIAQVVEGEASTGVPGGEDCTGQHALWQALGRARLGEPGMALAAEARSGRALERLPVALRLFAATLLGHAAADAGNWESARRFHAMGMRSAVGADPTEEASLTLLDARLARQRGEPDAAATLLRDLSLRTDEIGLRAQIALADLATGGDVHLPEDALRGLAADLGASALTRRGTPEGAAAFAAETELTRLVDGTAAALDLAAAGLGTGAMDEAAHADLTTRLAAGGESPDEGASTALAHAYIAAPARFGESLRDPTFRAALVTSLAAAGFPGIAEGLLDSDVALPDSARRAVAQAHLDFGAPDRAAAVAEALPRGPGRTELLARAALEGGDASAALRAASGDPSQGGAGEDAGEDVAAIAAAAAWRAGSWDAAVSGYDQIVARAPGVDEAVRLAYAAHRAGAATLPDVVRETLAASAPDLIPGLDALFRSGPVPASAEGAATLIEDSGDEIESMRRLLQDG